jgi:hypothetical protein
MTTYAKESWRRCTHCLRYYVPGEYKTPRKSPPYAHFYKEVVYEMCSSCKAILAAHDGVFPKAPVRVYEPRDIMKDMEGLT